jgi:hypothetical protein
MYVVIFKLQENIGDPFVCYTKCNLRTDISTAIENLRNAIRVYICPGAYQEGIYSFLTSEIP